MKKIVFILLIVTTLFGCKNFYLNKNKAILRIQIDKESEIYLNKYSNKSDNDLYELIIPVLKQRFKDNKIKMKYEIEKNTNDLILDISNAENIELLEKLIILNKMLEFRLVSKKGTEILDNLLKSGAYNGTDVNDEIIKQFDIMVPDAEILNFSKGLFYQENVDENNYIVVEKRSIFDENLILENIHVKENKYNQNIILFNFNNEDSKKWAEVTEKAAAYDDQIAIILDNVVLIAPRVMEKIPNGKCQLTLGNASLEELNALSSMLKYPQNIPVKLIEVIVTGK